MTIRILRLLGVYSEPGAGRIVTFPDNVVQLVDTVLEAEVVSGQLTRSIESEELRYFEPGQGPADDEIAPPARKAWRDWLAGQAGVIS